MESNSFHPSVYKNRITSNDDNLPFVFVECLEIGKHSQSVTNEVHRQDLIMSHGILLQQAYSKLLYIL